MQPTVFANVKDDMTIAKEEVRIGILFVLHKLIGGIFNSILDRFSDLRTGTTNYEVQRSG